VILKAELLIFRKAATLTGKMPVNIELAAPNAQYPLFHGWILVDADRLNCIRFDDGVPATFSDPGIIRRILTDLMDAIPE
jgi:hypothetical protein